MFLALCGRHGAQNSYRELTVSFPTVDEHDYKLPKLHNYLLRVILPFQMNKFGRWGCTSVAACDPNPCTIKIIKIKQITKSESRHS